MARSDPRLSASSAASSSVVSRPMIAFGEWAMWLAVSLAAATVILSLAGGLRGRAELAVLGRGTLYATFGATLLAAVGLWNALFVHDFSLRYVASNSSLNLPRIYTVAAFWAGHQGSLLLWILWLCGWSAMAVFRNRRAPREQMPWVTGTLGVLVLCFLAMLVLGANPFARLAWVPEDGLGMSARLQVPAMLVQPLLLAAGLAASSVPFALTIGALEARQFGARWEGSVRRWSLVTWLLLSSGFLLGLRWDYTSPDWSGGWHRDLARDSALLPWLSATAILYALVVRGGRRLAWIVPLSMATFVLSLASAYVARSGMVDSIHAYARSPVANGFLAVAAIAALAAIHLVRTRLGELGAADANAASDPRVASGGRALRLAYTLAGAGIAMLCVGLAGPAFRRDTRLTLGTGESATAVDAYGRTWTFASQGISSYTELNRQVLVLSVSLTRDGRRVGMLTSEQRQYVDYDENPISDAIIVAGLRSSPAQDVRVTFPMAVDRSTAVVQISFVPLVWWVWCGGLLMAIGGVLAMMSQQSNGEPDAAPRVSDEDVEAAIRRARETLVSCAECGPRPEPDAVYCSNCGVRLRDRVGGDDSTQY